jgi:hypothetical protein
MVDPSTWLRVNLEENRKVEMLKCLPAGRQVELSKRGLQSGWGRSNEEDERHKDEDGNQYRAGLPQFQTILIFENRGTSDQQKSAYLRRVPSA